MSTTETATPVRFLSRWERISSTSVVETYSVDPSGFYLKIVKTDTVRRKKPVDLFSNGTSFLYERLSRSNGRTFIQPNNNLRLWSQYSINALNYAQSQTALGSSASTKLLLKVKDQTSNLAVTIPELGKTTDMFFGLARDVVKALSSLRRARLGDAYKAIAKPRTPADKALANRWLELQYGLLPTVSDVYGLSESIHKKLKEDYIYCRAADQKEQSLLLVPSYDWPRRLRSLIQSHRVTARYRVSSQGLKSLAENGVTNPALAAWELVPYSFVVDYVINIGDYLAAVDALCGVSNFQVIHQYRNYVKIEGWAQNSEPGSPASSVYEVRSREKPVNYLYPDVPKISVSPTLTKALNIVSLLRVLK